MRVARKKYRGTSIEVREGGGEADVGLFFWIIYYKDFMRPRRILEISSVDARS